VYSWKDLVDGGSVRRLIATPMASATVTLLFHLCTPYVMSIGDFWRMGLGRIRSMLLKQKACQKNNIQTKHGVMKFRQGFTRVTVKYSDTLLNRSGGGLRQDRHGFAFACAFGDSIWHGAL
jgi:hypothetical protein